MTRQDRAALRRALLEAEPWLAATEQGPRAVDAGACDRCGELPRLLATCGPTAWEALCRRCGLEVGMEAWCDGHREEGREALRWAVALPEEWDLAVALWWVATGEVGLDSVALPAPDRLPATVRALVAPGSDPTA